MYVYLGLQMPSSFVLLFDLYLSWGLFSCSFTEELVLAYMFLF